MLRQQKKMRGLHILCFFFFTGALLSDPEPEKRSQNATNDSNFEKTLALPSARPAAVCDVSAACHHVLGQAEGYSQEGRSDVHIEAPRRLSLSQGRSSESATHHKATEDGKVRGQNGRVMPTRAPL